MKKILMLTMALGLLISGCAKEKQNDPSKPFIMPGYSNEQLDKIVEKGIKKGNPDNLPKELGGGVKHKNIFIGMSRKDMVATVGYPESRQVNGPYEKWVYEYANGLSDEMEFKNDRLERNVRWADDGRGHKRVVDIMH